MFKNLNSKFYILYSKLKAIAIFLWQYLVYFVKLVIWEAKKFAKNYPKAAKVIGIMASVLLFLYLVAFVKNPIITFLTTPRPPPFTAAPASSGFRYQAKTSKFKVTTYVGDIKNNAPVVEAKFESGSSVNFALSDVNPSISKPTQIGNTITFSNVRKDVDLKYQTLVAGVKESLIVKTPQKGNAFTFNINTQNAAPKSIGTNIYSSTFYGPGGNYLFDFEKPYAVDAKGERTNNVVLSVVKSQDRENFYLVRVIVNEKWLADPARVYPITIDPTVLYNATSQFSAGSFNRIADTQNSSFSNFATGGTITGSGGNIIHTFTSSGTFTPSFTGTVQVLVVAGGGGAGGGSYAGGGGGGGLVEASSYSITSGTPVTVTVGGGGSGGSASGSGSSGSDSVFGTITAVGGGAGGGYIGGTNNGTNGGSGGGGASNVGAAGSATQGNSGGGTGYGFNGGTGTGNGGAGGGGAGGIGANGTTGVAAGGLGRSNSISGSAVTYAAGGVGTNTTVRGASGAGNTGNGGEAGGASTAGGSGGSGIVIVSYVGSLPSLVTNYQELGADQYTVGLWHMNESANGTCSGSKDVCDSSGNGNNGSITGATINTSTQILGAAARTIASNSQNIDVADSNSIRGLTGKFTIEAWLKPAGNPFGSNNTVVDIGNHTANTGFGMWVGPTNTLDWRINQTYNNYSATALPTNQWSHFAIAYDGGSISMYLNGSLVSTTPFTTNPNQATTGIRIGRREGASTEAFNGSIDEVRISNIARSPEEIRLDAQRRPYGVYTSDVLALNSVNGWNSLQWSELGVGTGDGETVASSSGLIAQWNFNDTPATNIAVSGGSCGTTCNGTLTGFTAGCGISSGTYDACTGEGWTQNNARWPANGPKGLIINGGSRYINAGNQSQFNFGSGDHTYEIWLKTSVNSATYQKVMGKANLGGSPYTGTYFYIYSGKIIAYLNTTGTNGLASGNKVVADGNWHLIDVVYSRSTSQVIYYIDGVVDSTISTASISGSTDNTGNFQISDASSPINGVVDSARVYSRALGPSEILSNYNSSNVEFQTRVGNTTDPNDGTWDAWTPTNTETQLLSLDSAPGPSGCTGGTAVDGGTAYMFTASGTFQCSTGGIAQVLVVAGGGGGGVNMGGGGGGGGVLYNPNYTVGAGSPITVTVGNGGAGAAAGTGAGAGSAGQNSVFGTMTAIGGGGGGSDYNQNIYPPSAGGSGGGVAGCNQTTTAAGTTGQGYAGGGTAGCYYPGGGGGAGGAGSTNPATGGPGTYNDILGKGYFWGGGGGGSGYNVCGGNGGTGGGGGGTPCTTGGGSGLNAGSSGGGGGILSQTNLWGGNAGANTGGGGGGGAHYNQNNPGGTGGSGIVVVRIAPSATTDSVIKAEGSASQKLTPGAANTDSSTIALLRMDETGTSIASNSATFSPYSINTGTGNDGDCIMNNGTKTLDSTAGSSVCNGSARTTAYAVNYSVTANTAAGGTSITTSATPTGITTGDEILIINLQGAVNNYSNVGQYETHIVSSVAGSQINFTDYTLAHSYNGTNQKIMVQRVPNFGNVTVCGGNTGGGCTAAATLTATAWDGTRNGVLFFRATGTVTVNSSGTITTSVLGYRGGNGLGGGGYGFAGESYDGAGVQNNGANLSAGGGGYWSGAANADCLGGNASLESVAGLAGAEGSCPGYRGAPGAIYGDKTMSLLLLGSGGGGDAAYASAGGRGGGIMGIAANTITNNGSISNNGQNSQVWPYYGGAGGGGSIYFWANTVSMGTNTISNGGPGYSNGGNGWFNIASTNVSGVNVKNYPNVHQPLVVTVNGTTVVNGVVGKARQFNGTSDYLSIPNADALNLGNHDFTIEWWEYRTDSTNGKVTITSSTTDSGYTSLLAGYGNAGNVYFYSSSCGSACQWDISSNNGISMGSMSLNQWVHLAVVRNGQTITTYKNGIAQASATTNSNIENNPGPIEVGRRYDGSSYTYFKGSVDELKISSAARSPGEIAYDYQLGQSKRYVIPVASTNLTALQKLSFDVAADRPGTYLESVIGNSAYANYEPDANTVGLWHLEELPSCGGSACFKDFSGNGVNLFPSASLSQVQGQIGKAESFNGSSTFATNAVQAIASTANWTLEAWLYPTSISTTNIAVYNGDSAGMGFGIGNGAGAAGSHLQGLFGGVTWFDSGYAFPAANQWYYIVMTRDAGGTTRWYVNGAQVGTTSSAVPLSPAARFSLGDQFTAGSPQAGQYYSGIIDEARASNTARSAADIRAAYEVGKRSHEVTIDFGAKLDSGNLIADVNDKSFTVDATYYGFSSKGSNLYPGDKIIIHENVGGTDFYAQGTVNNVTASTGAVTVAVWDSGATFPSGGYTVNADVYKWQREYFDVTGSLTGTSGIAAQRNAITQLVLRSTNGSEGRNIWIDDLRSIGNYLTDPTGSTIGSATGKTYFQYRAIFSTTDYNNSASVTNSTTDFQSLAPNAPTTPASASQSATFITWQFNDLGTNETGWKVIDTNNNVTATCPTTNGAGTGTATCTETGLTPNTSYTRKFAAYNANGLSLYTATTTATTLAATPANPYTSSGQSTSLNLSIGDGTNPSTTEVAFYQIAGVGTCGSGGNYLKADGTSNGATPVWQTPTAWGTVNVTGLSLNTTQYTFCAKAHNNAAQSPQTPTDTAWTYNTNGGGYLPLGGNFTMNGNMTYANKLIDGNNNARYIAGLDLGPVGWWKFDESSGTATAADNSGNGNTGTSQSTTNVTTGKFNNARSFNGSSDYINVGSTIAPSSQITLEAWINSSDNTGLKYIISKRTGPENDWQLYLSSGKIDFSVWVTSSLQCSTIGGTTLSTGVWYHVAATYDGTHCYVYLNGVSDSAGGTRAGTILNGATSVTIGIDQIPGTTGRYFNGAIDEPHVYSVALTPFQIKRDMNTNNPQNVSNFILQRGTLTVGQGDTIAAGQFTFPSGSQASIALPTTSIKNLTADQIGSLAPGAPLWIKYADADGDGWTVTGSDITKAYAGTTAPSGPARRRYLISNLATNGTDCDDTSAAIHGTNITGGTVSRSGNYKIHTFTAGSSSLIVTCPGSISADYLVVGGGGGGGNAGSGGGVSSLAGGGGGGGVLQGTDTLTNTTYSITVGGGSGGQGNGSNSVFNGHTAIGGGWGGYYINVGGNGGGSGGGGGGHNSGGYGAGSGTAGPPRQGYDGGAGGATIAGGGGGGAGGGGGTTANTNTGGGGGPGISSSITGSPLYYAAGGGGGGYNGGGSGGSSIGGNGGVNSNGGNAAANTGSGGGGGSSGAGQAVSGGIGAGGTIIIRYLDP